MSAIFERTSVRKYQNKEVEVEKIDQILRAAMAAPSAANQQPWEFYVVKNKERLAALAEKSPYGSFIRDAAVAIVSVYRKELMMPEFADIDMAACTQNMLLEVTELGLGAVWVGVAPLADRMESVRQILNVPEHLVPYAIIPIGYPVAEAPQKDRFDATRVHFE